jgi:chitin disaccharide deacetylase
MRRLVANADDFGLCSGVNHGIVEAHQRGIVTSASLMVFMPGSGEAARLARELPTLSVGLHVSFRDARREPIVDLSDPVACRVALRAQLRRFTDLLDRPPTHVDSHHHVHLDPTLLPRFREVAEELGIPLRACTRVRYCSRFYGSSGQRHPERLSVGSLVRILARDVRDGFTELGCHPGRADPQLALLSSYSVERELELRTLCDTRVRCFLDDCGIELISFAEVARLLDAAASPRA